MTYVQAATGSGGWPMSCFLTPGLTPFVGATYFPPEDAYGRTGFKTVLKQVSKAWETRRDDIVEQSGQVLHLHSFNVSEYNFQLHNMFIRYCHPENTILYSRSK